MGIQAALDAGARYLEVDVQLSADRVPVLFHDNTLWRICRVGGAVHEKTLAELKQLRARDPDSFGERFADVAIASLRELVELLDAHSEVTCFVEIKPFAIERFGLAETAGRIVDMLAPLRDRIVVISSLGDVLPEARRQGARRTGLILERWEHAARQETLALEPDFLFCDVSKLPPGGSLATPRPLVVYDVINPRLALELGRRGVPYVETFAIGEMRRALGSDPAQGADGPPADGLA